MIWIAVLSFCLLASPADTDDPSAGPAEVEVSEPEDAEDENEEVAEDEDEEVAEDEDEEVAEDEDEEVAEDESESEEVAEDESEEVAEDESEGGAENEDVGKAPDESGAPEPTAAPDRDRPASPGARAPVQHTVLVMDLRPANTGSEPARTTAKAVDEVITIGEAQTVTTLVVEILAAHAAYRVVTEDEVEDLARQHQPHHEIICTGDACRDQKARIADATLVVTGSVGRDGDGFVVSLDSYDTRPGKPGGTGTRRVLSLEGLLHALPGLLAEVLGWTDDDPSKPDFILPRRQELLFAILDIRPQGLDQNPVDRLARALALDLKKTDDATVISHEDVERLLDPRIAKLRAECAEETGCLAEIGRALDVDKLVMGTIGKLGQAYVISLRLIDVHSRAIDSRLYQVIYDLEAQLAPGVAMASRRLLGRVKAGDAGGVVVTANVTGGEVSLDDEPVGDLPVLLHGLSPGRHALRVAKQGFFAWTSSFFIEPGKVVALAAQLEAIDKEPPWYEKWWLWVGISAAVVVCTSLTVALIADGASRMPGTTGGAFEL